MECSNNGFWIQEYILCCLAAYMEMYKVHFTFPWLPCAFCGNKNSCRYLTSAEQNSTQCPCSSSKIYNSLCARSASWKVVAITSFVGVDASFCGPLWLLESSLGTCWEWCSRLACVFSTVKECPEVIQVHRLLEEPHTLCFILRRLTGYPEEGWMDPNKLPTGHRLRWWNNTGVCSGSTEVCSGVLGGGTRSQEARRALCLLQFTLIWDLWRSVSDSMVSWLFERSPLRNLWNCYLGQLLIDVTETNLQDENAIAPSWCLLGVKRVDALLFTRVKSEFSYAEIHGVQFATISERK